VESFRWQGDQQDFFDTVGAEVALDHAVASTPYGDGQHRAGGMIQGQRLTANAIGTMPRDGVVCCCQEGYNFSTQRAGVASAQARAPGQGRPLAHGGALV